MKLIITTTLTIAKPLRLALFVITMLLLPSAAWGGGITDSKGITWKYGDGTPIEGDVITIPGNGSLTIKSASEYSTGVQESYYDMAMFCLSFETIQSSTELTNYSAVLKKGSTVIGNLNYADNLGSWLIETENAVNLNEPLELTITNNYSSDFKISIFSILVSETRYEPYALWIGNIQVHSGNKDNIMEGVSYNKQKNLLQLNSAHIENQIRCGYTTTIEMKGESDIISSSTTAIQLFPVNSYKDLTFKTADDDPTASLYLQTTGSNGSGIITGFQTIDWKTNGLVTSQNLYPEDNTEPQVYISKLLVNGVPYQRFSNTFGNDVVSYTPASNTLTLNNITTLTSIASGYSDLNIHLIGQSKITTSGDTYGSLMPAIIGSKGSERITFKTEDNSSGDGNCLIINTDQYKTSLEQRVELCSITNDFTEAGIWKCEHITNDDDYIKIYRNTALTSYDLTVAGISVTNENASNITGSGITLGTGGYIKYENSSKTLSLNNATINATTGINSNMEAFNIVVKGVNMITTSSPPIASLRSTQTATLSIAKDETASGVSSLEITNNTSNAAIIGFSSVSFDGLLSYDSNSSTKNYVALNYDNNNRELKNSSGSIVNSVYFENGTIYGLTIAGTAVTSANVGSDGTITGITSIKSEEGSVKYDDESHKLTLTNANIQGQIQWSKEESLIIEVNGMNKVINEKTDAAEPAISWTGTQQVPNLLIKKGDSESATLIFAGYKKASGYSVQNASNQVSGFSDPTYQNLNYGTLTSKSTDYTLVTYHCYSTEIYPVRVRTNYIQNISEEYYGHKDNVIDDSETPTVTYNNGVLTLNNANFYTGIGTGLENLTIDLKGNNIISTSTNNALLYGIGDGTHNIKFKSSSTPVGNLTLRSDIDAVSFVRNDVTITGFENDLSSTPSDLTKSVKEAFISKGTPIGLTVGNVFVTSDIWDGNGNITGVEGVRFTPANYVVDNPGASTPAILTLDNANISGNIQSSINELTVHLIGSNTITPGEGIAPFQYTGTGTGSLTFESSEADDGGLTLNGYYTESGSSPNKKITSGGYTTTTEFDTGLSYTFGDWIIETSKIYYNPHYGITINSYETTKCNKDNITKANNEEDVFSYSPLDKALSIPLDYDGSSTDIKSQRDDLIVLISGNTAIRSIIHEPSQSGTLLIKNAPSSSSTVNKLTLQNSTGAVISGFSTVTLDGLYFLTPNYPSVTTSTDWTSSINEAIITNETLSAPTMSSETVDGVSTLTLVSTADNGTIKYSIDYVDSEETDITDATYDSSSKPTVSKPATVTAKVTLNEVESATTTGKYFGTDPSPFRLISGADPIALDLTPAIEESDGISITSITGTESNVTYDAGTGKISSSSVGSFNGQVSMSSTEGKTVILNNNFTATFNVQIDISQAVITLDNTELIYNGQEQTVSVQKVMVGDDVVPQDYYEVSGNTGTEIGNYSLTVTAKTRDSQGNLIYNNYTGTATKEWKITNHPTASASELGFNTETQTFSTYYNPNEDFNLPDGYVGYIIKGIEGSKVLTVRISYIPKGVAVLVEKGTSAENPIEEIPDASEQPLKGTSEPLDVTSITGGIVYVLYNGMFVKSTSGTIPEKRCYLLIATNVAAGTRGFTIDHGEGTTALRGVPAEGTHGKSDAWYTLQGRKFTTKPTKPGLYILNGKKVVIK